MESKIGTSITNTDTDNDYISDGDEVLGTETGLLLNLMGLNPLRKNILIEYDWFEDNHQCDPHSHRVTPDVAEELAEMFRNAPNINPDGSTGIDLIQDYGQSGIFYGGNRISGYSPILPGKFDDTYEGIKRDNFDKRRLGYFHYMVMAHRYEGGLPDSSGVAEVTGDDAIIALGCFRGVGYVRNTIAHELGHNLGLHHGGKTTCNNKPNYNSVMNYRFQFRGVVGCGMEVSPSATANFSYGTRLNLNENLLKETVGVCGDTPIDWDGDNNIGMTKINLNPGEDSKCGGPYSILQDHDDWGSITLKGIKITNSRKLVAACGEPNKKPIKN